MKIKVHHVSLVLLILAAITHITAAAQREIRRTSAPSPAPPPNKTNTTSGNYTTLVITVPLFGGIALSIVIAVILFKRKHISSHGLILGFWMLMWFGSVVLNTWDIPRVSKTLVSFHVVVNVLGLVYWIRLGLLEYNRKNAWPSANFMFEIAAWFSMFTLSCVEVFVLTLAGEPRYRRLSHWYPVAIAFISMVENYWTKGREIREDRMKSQLIKNLEAAFKEVIRLCMEDPKKVDIVEFEEKVEEFYRLLDMLEAQYREAVAVAQQREALEKKVQEGDAAAAAAVQVAEMHWEIHVEGGVDRGQEEIRDGDCEIQIDEDRGSGARGARVDTIWESQIEEEQGPWASSR